MGSSSSTRPATVTGIIRARSRRPAKRPIDGPLAHCREHLRAGRDFAFNGTNTVRQTRKRWIDLFAGYGARVEVVYVEPPMPVIFEQNEHFAQASAEASDPASFGEAGAANVGQDAFGVFG